MNSKIFKKPEISAIVRDNEIIRPELRGITSEEKAPEELAGPAPVQSPPIEGVEPVRFIDPFQKWVNDKLDVIINKSIVVEAESIALQNQIISQIDRKLTGAPSTVIEAINSVIETPTGSPITNSDTLTECQLSCIAVASGAYGQKEEDGLEANLQDMSNNAQNDLSAFQNEVQNIGPKVTGLWLFFFMVRFIVAFCAHVTLGFMCCYLRNKLIIKVGPFRVRLGKIIAKPIGSVEIVVKDILGFPCGTGGAECLEPGKAPTEDEFRMFPCCQPDWESCGSSEGEASLSSPILGIGKCFDNLIRRVADEASGDPSSPDGSKPCQIGECEPDQWNQREQNAAKLAMDWLLAKSQAVKNSLNPDQIDKQQPQMKSDIDFFNSEKATDSINFSRSSRTIASGFKANFNDNYEAAVKVGPCDLSGPGSPFAALNAFGDMTQDDIKRALKNNVDTSFVNELRAAEADGTNLEFDGSKPPVEPFKTIYEAVEMLDNTLGGILDEMRKVVTQAKVLSGLLTDKIFCCVIYSIVILGNLVRFGKLCPDKDLQSLFDYAQDFGDNKDVKNLIAFLRLLQRMIDALNAELFEGIEGIGVGLPLGTMLELIKKAIASTVVALLAMALAPIDNALHALAANAKLSAALNENCFGIADLFNMMHCGIKWIFDLIKKWIMDLIPFKARNIELLANFKISGFKMKFLSKLSDMIKMLIDLLIGIGDCFPPEKIPTAILNKLPDQPLGAPAKVMPIPPIPPVAGKGITNYKSIAFEDIGNAVVDPATNTPVYGDDRVTVINDMRDEALVPSDGVGFPIYSEAIKIGFIDLLKARNGLTLAPAVPVDEFTFSTSSSDSGYVPIISKSREQILQDNLNMVKNLKNIR
jgi:hypothetical protein